jgi:serine-type D-Ala-D-Ala carboxypeptidase (penicillin-binding protein 5/6)
VIATHHRPAAALLGSLLLAVALGGGLVTPGVASARSVSATESATSTLSPPAAPVLEPAPADWPSIVGIDAAAYVLVEGATGQVLAARDADLRRPVASTVKVLTALTVLERSDLDDEVTAGDEVLGIEGSGVGLEPGDTWSVEDLLEALIARSGNEAAETLAVHVAGDTDAFAALMREDAVAMGLEEPQLVSPSGLDDDNLLSAMDLATISRVALAHPDLRSILGRGRVELPTEGSVESRNELLLTYQGATGVKTGFTAAAGNSLIGSAERGGRELIAVVLGSGDDPARFDQVAELLDLGFEATVRQELGAELQLAVGGGAATIEVPATTVTAPVDADAVLAFPVPRRIPDEDLVVPVMVDGVELGSLVGTVDTTGVPPPATGPEAIGRAVVDGAYAALRAAAQADTLR